MKLVGVACTQIPLLIVKLLLQTHPPGMSWEFSGHKQTPLKREKLCKQTQATPLKYSLLPQRIHRFWYIL